MEVSIVGFLVGLDVEEQGVEFFCSACVVVVLTGYFGMLRLILSFLCRGLEWL